MPYSKGCTAKARAKNVRLFIREGKHPAQANAIAFSIQRENCRCRAGCGPRGGTKCYPRKRR